MASLAQKSSAPSSTTKSSGTVPDSSSSSTPPPSDPIQSLIVVLQRALKDAANILNSASKYDLSGAPKGDGDVNCFTETTLKYILLCYLQKHTSTEFTIESEYVVDQETNRRVDILIHTSTEVFILELKYVRTGFVKNIGFSIPEGYTRQNFWQTAKFWELASVYDTIAEKVKPDPLSLKKLDVLHNRSPLPLKNYIQLAHDQVTQKYVDGVREKMPTKKLSAFVIVGLARSLIISPVQSTSKKLEVHPDEPEVRTIT
jgi:hypothetical protein